MEKNLLSFSLPFWWAFPCLILAFGLAWVLYTKKNVPWGRNQNIILGTLRFTAVFLILLLFLEPVLRNVTSHIERPHVVLAVDNSASVSAIHSQEELSSLQQNLQKLKKRLEADKDYKVEIVPADGDSMNFNSPLSDYSGLLRRISEEYRSKNIGSVVLMGDGIYNRGISPAYQPTPFTLHTLGLGDTTQRKDVGISDLRFNEVAYLGNKFPVEVSVNTPGFQGETITVAIQKGGQTVTSKVIRASSEPQTLNFLLSSEEKGIRRFDISVTRFEGEVTYANNERSFYIDILENRKKVLVRAKAPHPDIKAIRSVLEATGNYEVLLDIPGLDQEKDKSQFDVQVLFDGMPPRTDQKAGIWLINSSSDGVDLRRAPFLTFTRRGTPDQARVGYNTDFSKFSLNEGIDRLMECPPLTVPFGNYQLTGPFEVLFYQKVGSVATSKPLLAVFDDGQEKMAVLMGTGIWKWQLQEAAQFGDQRLFDEWVSKLVQYLAVDQDKKQFRVDPVHEVFAEGEEISFDVEIYNEIYEFATGIPYNISIEGGEKEEKFEFVFSPENRTAKIPALSPADYTFTATTQVGGKQLVDQGKLVVAASELEMRSLQADHELLRQLSAETGGRYFHFNQMDNLENYLIEADYSGTIRSQTSRTPMINIWWVLGLVALLLITEWTLRKYWGGY